MFQPRINNKLLKIGNFGRAINHCLARSRQLRVQHIANCEHSTMQLNLLLDHGIDYPGRTACEQHEIQIVAVCYMGRQ